MSVGQGAQGASSSALITIALVVTAIAAFAGNSLLARAALGDGAIEAGAYSAIRLLSGALILLPVLGGRPTRDDLPGAAALTIYVAGFSLAYLDLAAGVGALILFGFVQVTIIAYGLFRGEPLKRAGWVGIILALVGLIWVLEPWNSLASNGPGLLPSLLMASAGVAWGAYTLIGRGSAERPGGASGSTARSFLIASVLVAPMLALDSTLPSWGGIVLAILSGAVTSGLGYVIWYKVAPTLGLASVACVQLATPVAAALGGAVFLSEALTLQLVIGGVLILGGILLTLHKPD